MIDFYFRDLRSLTLGRGLRPLHPDDEGGNGAIEDDEDTIECEKK